ncbi:MAG: site-2 protease family protein [Terriglobales bacterium]|jgi:Zn-dependent protease
MTQEHVNIVFQVIVFLFAISVHESAHAWTAMRLGDPTAYMVGRVTLNPIKHIDPWGTVILPLMAVITHFPIIGWAKPTPVNTRNFKRLVRDDILTSVAGPVSNLLVAIAAVLLLVVMEAASPNGHQIVQALAASNGRSISEGTDSMLLPVSLLLYNAMFINVLLAVFNLIPVPPLDGSHVLRHFLSPGLLRIYDGMGIFGLMFILFFGGRLLGMMLFPVVAIFNSILLSL